MTGRTKHALILVTIACAAVLCLAGCSGNSNSSSSESSSSSSATQENQEVVFTVYTEKGKGETVQVTGKQIAQEYVDNEVAAKNKYENAPVAFTAPVSEIKSAMIYNDHRMTGGLYMSEDQSSKDNKNILVEYSGEYKDFVAGLKVGDLVHVSGAIYHCSTLGGNGVNHVIEIWNVNNNKNELSAA